MAINARSIKIVKVASGKLQKKLYNPPKFNVWNLKINPWKGKQLKTSSKPI